MLRINFLQQWFNLSDPGAEDAPYESPVLHSFAGVDLGRAAAPDETTILNSRHLMDKHELTGKIPDTVNLFLASKASTFRGAPSRIPRSSLRLPRPEREEGARPRDALDRTGQPILFRCQEEEKRKNRNKSRVRARVEWSFRISKRVFHYTKVRYRGIKKNHEWLLTAFGLVNLYQHRKWLDPTGA
jgi:IS5 family transposase